MKGVRRLLGRDKQEKLEALAAGIRKRGVAVAVDAKVLGGRMSMEIIREVQRGRHGLLLRVA